MAWINEDSERPINQITVAVILREHAPRKGVQIISETYYRYPFIFEMKTDLNWDILVKLK